MPRFILALFVFVITTATLNAQDSISGIINHYATVTAFDRCARAITVDETDGFAVQDTLLLFQMQGATINTSNTGSYGELSSLNNAGRYEKAVIESITGSTITLAYTPLYEYEPAQRVQIVSYPHYTTAIVTDTLKAQPWDGNSGGLLAFSADSLVLEADIDASGTGFRGGVQVLDYDGDCFWFLNHDDFLYNEGSIRSGRKGEGIAAAGVDQARGRGAQLNGGGGGNDHNSGGGGGGNIAAGGRGGINDNPSTFGCQGDFPGRGGRGVGFDPLRLYMGGGGGAGHTNNTNLQNGAHGGGIILIEASYLAGNGYTLRSNGLDAPDANGDGANGGGAGGTIYLRAATQNESGLQLEIRGGDGGNANNSGADQCFGPGGGGSGGLVLATDGLNFTPLYEGGTAGSTINSASCPDGNNGAQNGQEGQQALPLSIPVSQQILEPPVLVEAEQQSPACLSSSATLSATFSGSSLTYQWQVDTGNGFEDLTEGSTYQNVNTSSLFIPAVTAGMFTYEYQLVASNACGTVSSPVILLIQEAYPVAFFSFTINGNDVSFENLSTDADSYEWDFAGLGNSTATDASFSFPGPGSYPVTLAAMSEACDGFSAITLTVVIQSSPVAIASPEAVDDCAPGTFTFTNNSQNFEEAEWYFPGSTEVVFNLDGPAVTYELAGNYEALLIVSNTAGADTLIIPLTLSAGPSAGFDFSVNGSTVDFNNTTVGGNSYSWDFGGLSGSTLPNPSYNFEAEGVYSVSLIAENECGADTIVQNIQIGNPPVPIIEVDGSSGGCAPLLVQFQQSIEGNFDSLLWSFPGGQPTTSTESSPSVIYDTPGLYNLTLTVYSSFPPVSQTAFQLVEVFPRPMPSFSYAIDGLTVSFINLSTQSNSYVWNFGDGNTSNEENPVHTYAGPGSYNVTLNASSSNCNSAISESVVLSPNSTSAASTRKVVRLFPNPNSGVFCIDTDWQWERWQLYGLHGQLIQEGIHQPVPCIQIAGLAAGLYSIRLSDTNETVVLMVVIQ